MPQRLSEEQNHSHRDTAIRDIEDWKGSHLEEICHEPIEQTVSNICQCTTENETKGTLLERRVRSTASEEKHEKERHENEPFLSPTWKSNAKGNAGIQYALEPHERTDESDTTREKMINDHLRGNTAEEGNNGGNLKNEHGDSMA